MTLIDSADVYGSFTNKELVGRALSGGHRERGVLTTKVAWCSPIRGPMRTGRRAE